MAVTVPCHWKDWNNHLEGHRQWALTKQKVCGTGWVAEASPGVDETVPGEVEPIDPYVFIWAGLVQGCLRNHSGASGT